MRKTGLSIAVSVAAAFLICAAAVVAVGCAGWGKDSGSTIPDNSVRVHYIRADGNYSDMTLWVWEDADWESPGGWPNGIPWTGKTSAGVYFDVPLKPDARTLGFLAVNRKTGDAGKDGGDKRFELLDRYTELWIRQDDDEVYISSRWEKPTGETGSAESPDPNRVWVNNENRKFVVYQVMTRLFGNTVTNNIPYGTIEENGVGKFSDFTPRALAGIKELGVGYIYYTGVIRHALMDDFTAWGIPRDNPWVIKGRAGSPFAITDYYDVNPVLADNVANRLEEFRALVRRTNEAGMKVMIDFVPNHVARAYQPVMTPPGVRPLGEGDNSSVAFDRNNNFYYLPGTRLTVPVNHQPTGENRSDFNNFPMYNEEPAKATGNDIFSPHPSLNDWFETVKINYGLEFPSRRRHFDPVPATWVQMRDILLYWVSMGVQGFRVDMVEMVPVEFWAWAIPQVKATDPEVIFVAELYNPSLYRRFITPGGFDYIYNKVGLYDTLRPLTRGVGNATRISRDWIDLSGIHSHMLNKLENHDEQRSASRFFAGNPERVKPAMVVTSTLSSGPVMLYFGQEVGEPAEGRMGFSGDDGRTTIFDYWGVPEHQKWMNGGKFDGGGLSREQKELRQFYVDLLNFSIQSPAVNSGRLYDLTWANLNRSAGYQGRNHYAYLRIHKDEVLLFFINFNYNETAQVKLKIPEAAWRAMGVKMAGADGGDVPVTFQSVMGSSLELSGQLTSVSDLADENAGFNIEIPAGGWSILRLQ